MPYNFVPSSAQLGWVYDLLRLYDQKESLEAVADIVMSRSADLFDDYLQLAASIRLAVHDEEDKGDEDLLAAAMLAKWLDIAVIEMSKESPLTSSHLKKIRPLLKEAGDYSELSWFADKENIRDAACRFHRLFFDRYEITPEKDRLRIFDDAGFPKIEVVDAYFTLPGRIFEIEIDAHFLRSHEAAARVIGKMRKSIPAVGKNLSIHLAPRVVNLCLCRNNPLHEAVGLYEFPMPGQYLWRCVENLLDGSQFSSQEKRFDEGPNNLGKLIAENPGYAKNGLGQDLFRYLAPCKQTDSENFMQPGLVVPGIIAAVKAGFDVVGLAAACRAKSWFASQLEGKDRDLLEVEILRAARQIESGSVGRMGLLGFWHLHSAPRAELMSLPLPDEVRIFAYQQLNEPRFLMGVRNEQARDRALTTDLGL